MEDGTSRAMQGQQKGRMPSRATVEAAADWLIRLRASPDDAALAARFEDWLAARPEHQLAFDAQCRTWSLLGDLRSAPSGVRAPPRAVPRAVSRTSPRRAVAVARPPRALPRRSVLTLGALAAGLAILLLPGVMLRMGADHVTGTGETRTVTLEDGSSVTLGGDSALATRFAPGRRTVRLISGEAYFDVKPDPSRPFVVDAGEAEVRVLGTAFDVRLGAETAVVALARGAVQATFGAEAARTMVPGERLHYDTTSHAVTREQVPVEDIGAWRDGRLVVTDATVGEVVERIRRYHPAWIALPDAGLSSARVTGVYDLRHPDAALSALVEPFGGRVHALSPYLRVIARL